MPIKTNTFQFKILVVFGSSASLKIFGVSGDPLFENLGVIGKFRGSELFNICFQFNECVFIAYI